MERSEKSRSLHFLCFLLPVSLCSFSSLYYFIVFRGKVPVSLQVRLRSCSSSEGDGIVGVLCCSTRYEIHDTCCIVEPYELGLVRLDPDI